MTQLPIIPFGHDRGKLEKRKTGRPYQMADARPDERVRRKFLARYLGVDLVYACN